MSRDRWTWAGLAIVGIAAAVLSFTALADLAHRCGITGTVFIVPLSWLLPVTVDVLAAVTTRVWLRGTAAPEAVRYARRSAWAAIVGSLVGNSAHGYILSAGVVPPWPAAVAVAAVPALALGGLVHLAVLVSRPAADATAPTQVDEDQDEEDETPPVAVPLRAVGDPDPEPDLPDRRAAVDTSDLTAVVADLQAEARRLHRRFNRDEIRTMYGIGADKAMTARRVCGWAPDPTDTDREAAGALR